MSRYRLGLSRIRWACRLTLGHTIPFGVHGEPPVQEVFWGSWQVSCSRQASLAVGRLLRPRKKSRVTLVPKFASMSGDAARRGSRSALSPAVKQGADAKRGRQYSINGASSWRVRWRRRRSPGRERSSAWRVVRRLECSLFTQAAQSGEGDALPGSPVDAIGRERTGRRSLLRCFGSLQRGLSRRSTKHSKRAAPPLRCHPPGLPSLHEGSCLHDPGET